MGTGSSRSSQVHSFQNESTNSRDVRPKSKTVDKPDKPTINFQARQSIQSNSSFRNEERKENASPVSHLASGQSEQEQLILQLKKELGESESNNLDLQDRIQLLEEQIYNLQAESDIPKQQENVQETLKLKDQLIANTSKEKDQLQQDLHKMKIRYKRRIKLLTSQVNEAKQETSIQMFELRDEINRLTEENKELHEKVDNKEGNKQVFIETDYLSTSIHGNSSQMKVVLELSNQISEQQTRIQELESQVEDREELLKINGISLDQISKNKNQFSDNDHIKQEKSAMRKLSESMFPNASEENHTDDDMNIFSGEDNRGFSGASRDSGIGSAGKGGRVSAKIRNKKKPLSPLEDSDDSWQSDTPLSSRDQNKIKSAPLENHYKRAASRSSSKMHESEDDVLSIDYEMENVAKATKMKKKTSFTQKFRRENDSSIRTPVPYEAFGGPPGDTESSPTKRRMKSKKHFFMTQPTSSQASTPTNEIDALLA